VRVKRLRQIELILKIIGAVKAEEIAGAIRQCRKGLQKSMEMIDL